MKKILLFLFTFQTLFIFSQDFYEDYNDYLTFFNSKSAEPIERLNRFGYHYYFKYNKKDIEAYKNDIKTLEKIRYAYIKINKDINLEEVIDDLSLCPNIELIKFDNGKLFGSDTTKINFPKNLNKLSKLKNLIFYSFHNWDYDKGFYELKKVKSLKGIAFYSFSPTILMNKNFQELKLKDLAFIARNIPQIPENNTFENLILKCDYYPNKKKQYLKTLSKNNLKKLHLSISFENLNDSILKELKHLQGLEKLTINSPIKNSDSFFKIIGENNPKIKELKLANCKLDSLSENIKCFKNLELFYSSNNKFKKLPKSFYDLKNLKRVEIQGSNIISIDNEIDKLSSLNTLKLYYNRIKILPKSIGKLKLLKHFSINNNQLKSLPKEIGDLKNITFLKINNNELTSVPRSITNLKNLDTLFLEDNYIKELPKNIGNLSSLTYLNLSQNLLYKLPNSFSKLHNLQTLNITANDITYLPKKFGNLKKLSTLQGNSNFLTTLPDSFGDLSSLERLELSHNNLTSLPDSFGGLNSLKKLYLNNKKNHAFRIEKYNHLKGNFIKDTTYTRLARKKNMLTTLPDSFSKLSKLEFIDLSNNTIDFNNVFNILENSNSYNYTLDVSNCFIKKLPVHNWNTFKVKDLNLSDNLITELPKDIKNAQYLTSLNISRNLKNLNTYRNNKNQISLLLLEHNIISENDLPKTDEMAIAFAKVANKKSYSSKKNKYEEYITYANKAIEINKEAALKTLYDDSYIEALYKTKNYKNCIHYADITIEKDTSQNIRFLNSVVPNFRFKALSHLGLKDTISAVKTFKTLADKFSPQYWSRTALLAKKINDSDYKLYFDNQIAFYNKKIQQNPKSWGTHLSLLEVYIIAGKHTEFDKFNKELSTLIPKNSNYLLLKEYLEFVEKISVNNYSNKNLEELKRKIQAKKTKFKTWSFELLLLWNDLSGLSNKQKNNIRALTNLFKLTS